MRIESVEGGLQLLHVDDHFALVIAAGAAHAMGHLGLAAAGAGGEVDDVDVVVRPATSAPGLREFAFRIRHTFSVGGPPPPLIEGESLAKRPSQCKGKVWFRRRRGGMKIWVPGRIYDIAGVDLRLLRVSRRREASGC